MRIARKFFGFLMILIGLTGCKHTTNQADYQYMAKEYHFLQEIISKKENQICDIQKAVYKNDCLYVIAGFYMEATGEHTNPVFEEFVYCIAEDEIQEETKIAMEITDEIRGFDIDHAGTYIYLIERYVEKQQEYEYCLLEFGKTGKKENEIFLNQYIEAGDCAIDFKVDIQGNRYVFFDTGSIVVLDQVGTLLFDIQNEETYIQEVNMTKDGTILYVAVTYNGKNENMYVYQIRVDEKIAEAVVKLDAEKFNGHILINGYEEYDFYINDNIYIYGYRIKEESQEKMMNWVDSNLSTDMVDAIFAQKENTFIVIEHNRNLTIPTVQLLSKRNREENKQTLKLGCLYMSAELQNEIATFNKENEAYHIEVVSYDNRENPLQAFIMNLTAGDVPDIILIPREYEEILMQKQLLEDLYPFIDEDMQLSREDFLSNIVNAYERDGKLYQTISKVYILAWATRRSYIEEDKDWTMQALLEMLENNPDSDLFSDMEPMKILEEFSSYMLCDFVNRDAGACNFASKEFIELLELAKQYGKEKTKISIDEEIEGMKKGSILFSSFAYVDPEGIQLYDTLLGGDCIFIGCPAKEGNGSAVYSEHQFAITSNSQNKEGAWQFVRTFFTKEYQDLSETVIMFGSSREGIPVRKDGFESFVKRFTAKESYYEKGIWIEPVEVDCSFNGYDYMLEPLSKRQEEILREVVTGVTQKFVFDETIHGIIREEARGFFAGEKSSEDTARVIQNRVTTYMHENQ